MKDRSTKIIILVAAALEAMVLIPLVIYTILQKQ
jgi:hypothetical protein